MKKIVVPFSILTGILFFLFSFIYFTNDTNGKQAVQSPIQNQIIPIPTPGTPIRIIIPAIQIDAGIQQLGVTSGGEMEVPNTIIDAGWLKSGSRPGEIGSAVIAGHFNGKNGEPGVFAQLNTLKKGDKIQITDDTGTSRTFMVRETRIYNPGYADEVFSKNDAAHLNLVTCNGFWNTDKNSYSKRFVVFADITH
jgi:LPXTG-site transpeptidase (sortase) family protein